METTVLDVAQYGLQENKAELLKKAYLPMFDMLEEMEKEFNQVVELPKESAGKEARILRLKIAKVRTTGDKARKAAKAENIRENKAIQGIYNTLEYATKSKESTLLEIEKYKELLRQQLIEKLQAERSLAYSEFTEEGMLIPGDLGEMEESIWNNFIFGAKANFEAMELAQKEAEKRAVKGKKDEAKRLREIEEDNKIKSEEIARMQEEIAAEKVISKAKQNAFLKKIEEEKIAREERASREKKAAEERDVKAKKEEAERLRKIEEERDTMQKKIDANKRAEKERKEKDKIILKAKNDKRAREEAKITEELARPDKEKLLILAGKFDSFKIETLRTEKGIKLGNNIELLLKKIAKYITEKTNEF